MKICRSVFRLHTSSRNPARDSGDAGREHFYTPYVGTLVGATTAVSPVPKKALSQIDLREVTFERSRPVSLVFMAKAKAPIVVT